MSERQVLRMLKRLVSPAKIGDMYVADGPNGTWAARVSVLGGSDRWFKGDQKTCREEIWFPGEDAHRQYALP